MKRITAVVLSLFLTSIARAETFKIDPAHSSLTFTVRHLVGRVSGHFDKFDGSFDYDAANPKAWKTAATIDTTSVNTGNQKRDDHLRTAEFFDAQKFPTMSFKSTGVTDVKDNTAKLQGDLTLHGVTKPVVLNLEINGMVKDPFGAGHRAGAVATGKINRKDFGVGSGKMETMNVIGDDVDLTLNIEGVSAK
jgi:polyisoprenoid-binding protein YceI